jgi:hypothetical protein
MKRAILGLLAAVLVVAAITGVFVVRSHSSSAKPAAHAASWTTYTDGLGLFSISYPTGWTLDNTRSSAGNAWLISSSVPGGDHYLAASWDSLYLAYSTNRYVALDITAIEINTPTVRSYFCKSGTPTSPANMPPGGIGFNTGNAHIIVRPGSSALQLPIVASEVTQARAAGNPATYASILATFKSLASKGSAC